MRVSFGHLEVFTLGEDDHLLVLSHKLERHGVDTPVNEWILNIINPPVDYVMMSFSWKCNYDT